jgi:uncharacterized SAM-binding protein YcdF (DUF218 family)
MVPSALKELFLPGSVVFFLLAATAGTLLLYRKTHNGRAGRRLLTALVVSYWILSTPASAVMLIRLLTPDYPPVQTPADTRGASAIVVLGGGMDTYRSRGAVIQAGSREHSLRALEAARVYHLLDRPWVIVSGSLAPEAVNEATHMARSLARLGVPTDRVVEEGQSRNTRDHTAYVPSILAARGVTRFVLVTSRQHMARALRAFRVAGLDPVPSSPDFFEDRRGVLSRLLPSSSALDASRAMVYDLFALVYYRIRGWA